jgi:hypothetical protein
MNIYILHIFTACVLFRCKSYQTVFVQKNCHRIDYRCYKHIDSKIVLMLFPECRLLNILLNYVGVIFIVNSWWFYSI